MAVNIVKDYSWTSSPKGSQLRNEAPLAYVRAYKLKTSQLKQTVDGYMNVVKKGGSADEFYKNLYKGEKLEDYHFPYFNDNFRSFSNEYADTLSNVTDRGQATVGRAALEGLKDVAENVMGIAATIRELQGTLEGGQSDTPGSYIETPKFYQYANTDAPLQIQFPLLNTIDEGDKDKNIEFIKKFIEINRPERENAIAMSFPAIYKIKVPGLRFIEWAYLQDLSFDLLGTRRKIGDEIVPEGFNCSMTFRSLTVEVANFLEKV